MSFRGVQSKLIRNQLISTLLNKMKLCIATAGVNVKLPCFCELARSLPWSQSLAALRRALASSLWLENYSASARARQTSKGESGGGGVLKGNKCPVKSDKPARLNLADADVFLYTATASQRRFF